MDRFTASNLKKANRPSVIMVFARSQLAKMANAQRQAGKQRSLTRKLKSMRKNWSNKKRKKRRKRENTIMEAHSQPWKE